MMVVAYRISSHPTNVRGGGKGGSMIKADEARKTADEKAGEKHTWEKIERYADAGFYRVVFSYSEWPGAGMAIKLLDAGYEVILAKNEVIVGWAY